MTAKLARAKQKKRLVDTLQSTIDRVRTHIDLERAQGWDDFLAYYAVLCGFAHCGDGELETAIAPIVDFMSYGPRAEPKKAAATNEDKEVVPVKAVKDANGSSPTHDGLVDATSLDDNDSSRDKQQLLALEGGHGSSAVETQVEAIVAWLRAR